MNASDAKSATGELRIIYMNGSIVPLAGHELVAALRSRQALTMLLATVVLLSLPSGGGVLGTGSAWVRILANVAAVLFFAALFPALLADALNRASRKGKQKIHLVTVTVPAAILSTLSAEAVAFMLTGTGMTRLALLSRLCLGVLFWEVIAFLAVWFYAPVLGPQTAADAPARPEDPTLTIKGLSLDPRRLHRIETEGRHLHLHTDEGVRTVSARMQDVAALLEPHGVMVHRCHWVAHHQLGPVAVKGRSYEMTTRQGDKVPVSRDRRDPVRALLTKATQP